MNDENPVSGMETKSKKTLLVVLVGDPKSPWWGGAGSPLVTACLSLILPGLGQLYNREPVKALVYFVGTFALWFLLLGWIPQALAVLEPLYKAYRKAMRSPSHVV